MTKCVIRTIASFQVRKGSISRSLFFRPISPIPIMQLNRTTAGTMLRDSESKGFEVK